ncbi:15065_t:CDS:2 [Funneliformis mosseae]|uniref:15065_t:CDS:1 n=1 Tax=Funneliformis mosseae TaxID=27381 RepID=A0A9N9AWZ2_FUNMO|nr:15065_t:CDS:2 [Funneliformis mosseae]
MKSSLLSCFSCFVHKNRDNVNESPTPLKVFPTIRNEGVIPTVNVVPNTVENLEVTTITTSTANFTQDLSPLKNSGSLGNGKTFPINKGNSTESSFCCGRKNCNSPRSTDPNNSGKSFTYCTSNCFWEEIHTLTTSKLTLLSENDPDYDRVKTRFDSTIHNNAEIKFILRLQMSKMITDKFLEHKQLIAENHAKDGNMLVHRMFHGTYYACSTENLWNDDRKFCAESCGMCGIIQKGMLKEVSRQNPRKLWFAKNARISLEYCRYGNENLFTMFVVDVVNAQEAEILVIDNNEATLPRFLIIFKVKGSISFI